MLEKQFYRHLEDLIDRNLARNVPVRTAFLDLASQGEAEALCRKRGCRSVLLGGYDGAERKILCLLADYQEAPEDGLIACIAIRSRGRFAHPDLLGALMAMGVKRDCLGDLCLQVEDDGGTFARVYCLATMAEHLAGISSVGRHEVQASVMPSPNPEEDIADASQDDGRRISVSLASLRVDSVVAAAFSLPRSRAAALFDMGAVQLNWQPCEDRGKLLKPGDTLSVRRHGRVLLEESGGRSRKGRIFVTLKVFA